MTTTDFKPIYCTACGKLIWIGICTTGFLTRLDPEPITITEEIIKRIQQIRSYELFRTAGSFEAIYRSLNQIKRSDPAKAKIILASHSCEKARVTFRFKGQQPEDEEMPDYWNRRRAKQEHEGIPF